MQAGGRIAAIGTAALVMGFAGMSVFTGNAAGLLPYEDAAAVARGQELYREYCAACHGANLEGQENWRQRRSDGKLPAPPHDETGHTWHHPDQQLVAVTTLGTKALVGPDYPTDMIGFGELMSEQEILDVLAFIKSTWPDELIEAHDGINEEAAKE